jgi:hypothetical protein
VSGARSAPPGHTTVPVSGSRRGKGRDGAREQRDRHNILSLAHGDLGEVLVRSLDGAGLPVADTQCRLRLIDRLVLDCLDRPAEPLDPPVVADELLVLPVGAGD